MKAYFAAMRAYWNFFGRMRRKEFWQYLLTIVALILGAIIADFVIFGRSVEQLGPLCLIMSFVHVVPTLAASARRLHDVGRSARWLWIAPTGIGALVLIYWYLLPGEPDTNRFGTAPRRRPASLLERALEPKVRR